MTEEYKLGGKKYSYDFSGSNFEIGLGYYFIENANLRLGYKYQKFEYDDKEIGDATFSGFTAALSFKF
jgi:opacity protein-like surface antigen